MTGAITIAESQANIVLLVQLPPSWGSSETKSCTLVPLCPWRVLYHPTFLPQPCTNRMVTGWTFLLKQQRSNPTSMFSPSSHITPTEIEQPFSYGSPLRHCATAMEHICVNGKTPNRMSTFPSSSLLQWAETNHMGLELTKSPVHDSFSIT
jgi:hypothetical protein